MVLLLFSFLFASDVVVVRPSTFPCNGETEATLEFLAGYIRQNFRTRDVSEHIDKLELTIEKCKISPTKFGLNEKIYNLWREKSYDIRIKEHSARIIKLHRFKNIESDLIDHQELLELAGRDKYNINSLSVLKDISRSLSEQDQNRCSKPLNVNIKTLGEVRDQGSVGWCYAFTAADILSQKLEHRISAAHIAVTYYDNFISRGLKTYLGVKDTAFQGGIIGDSIRQLQAVGGACLEDNFRSDDNGETGLSYNLKQIATQTDKENCARNVSQIFTNIKLKDIENILSEYQRGSITPALAKKKLRTNA